MVATLAMSSVLVLDGPAGATTILNVPMGILDEFAVLASSTVTITADTVEGSVGVWPGTAITGITQTDMIGDSLIHAGDSVAEQAQSDLTVAYQNAATRPAAAVAGELGGLILGEGVYRPGEAALTLTGILTLDGNDDLASVFIIQTAAALTTAASSTVLLINGAQECNVFWQVSAAVTLGASSTFRGNLMAEGALTAGDNVTFRGRAFSRAGAITFAAGAVLEPTCQQPPIATTTTVPETTITTVVETITTTVPVTTTTVPVTTTTVPVTTTTTVPVTTTTVPVTTTTTVPVTTTTTAIPPSPAPWDVAAAPSTTPPTTAILDATTASTGTITAATGPPANTETSIPASLTTQTFTGTSMPLDTAAERPDMTATAASEDSPQVPAPGASLLAVLPLAAATIALGGAVLKWDRKPKGP